MAGFADTLRGDGLARAQRALAALEGDPQRLDRARVRFDDSPPPYTSDRSGSTTRSASPISPSEQRRQERRSRLGLERMASEPYYQLQHQIGDEKKRIREADIPIGSDAHTIASAAVKKRWIEQGIWNNKWNKLASFARWKHEEPLELESESETNTGAESSRPSFSLFSKEPQTKPRHPKSDEEKRRIAERRVVREREREASRPYHQFIYQVSRERERIQEESANGEGADAVDIINTRAYEIVKNTWTKRGIWKTRWGVLPGMAWKHEQPFEDEEDEGTDGPIPVSATANRNAQPPVSNGAGQAPFPPLFGPRPPVEPNHLQGPRDEEPLRLLPEPNSFFHPRNAQPPPNHEAGKAPFAGYPSLFGSHPPVEPNHLQGPRDEVRKAPFAGYPSLFGSRPPLEPNHPHGSRGPKSLLERSIGKYGGIYDGDLQEEMIANGIFPADFFTKRIRPSTGDDRPSEDGPNLADADADEEPLEETADGPAPVPANPLVNGNHKVGEAPAIRISGSLSPVESNHLQVSGALNSSQQRPFADIDSAGLENGNAERSPSVPNSPRLRTGKRVLRHAAGQASRSSKRGPSQKEGQPQPVASTSLGPVHSSKVSKAVVKKKPGPQRRLNILQKVSSDGLPLSSSVDAAEPQPSPPPDRETPRRSKRIRPPVHSEAQDSAKTASTDPPKRAARPKPERKVASSPTTGSLAKPQGVSKRQPAKTARGKARKK